MKIPKLSIKPNRKEKDILFVPFILSILLVASLLLFATFSLRSFFFSSLLKDRRGGKVTDPRSIAEPKQYIHRRYSGRYPPHRSVFWYSVRIAKRRASEMRCQVYLFDTS